MAPEDVAGQALLGLRNAHNTISELPIDAPREILIKTINTLIADYNKNELAIPWTVYTPTLTNITLGNGTIVAKYKKIGSTVLFEVVLTFGTTTAFATVANYTQSPRVSLPMTGIVNSWTGVSTTSYNGAVMPNAARMTYDTSAASTVSSASQPQWYDANNFYDANLAASTTTLHDVGDKVVWSAAYEAAA